MSIHLQDSNHLVRSVSEIKMHDGTHLREAYVLKMKVNGVLRIVWQKNKGYIFTNDGYAIRTSDGHYVKCRDQ